MMLGESYVSEMHVESTTDPRYRLSPSCIETLDFDFWVGVEYVGGDQGDPIEQSML